MTLQGKREAHLAAVGEYSGVVAKQDATHMTKAQDYVEETLIASGARREGMTFKNALCLAPQPDFYTYPGYWNQCHRHHAHPGRHRIKFQDGGVREWGEGEKETELTTKPGS